MKTQTYTQIQISMALFQEIDDITSTHSESLPIYDVTIDLYPLFSANKALSPPEPHNVQGYALDAVNDLEIASLLSPHSAAEFLSLTVGLTGIIILTST